MIRITRIIVLVALCTAAPARADWPLPRGDRARSGATPGQSNLVAPVPYWRYYLGGAIGPRQARVLDIDGDGRGALVFVAGGKLQARDRDGALRWETPVLGIDGLVAVDDLDGDGQLELVARTGDRVIIVSAAGGQVLWAQPGDDLGTLADVRVADLDADGLSDILVQECGCCRINNGATGFAYRFARGFGAAERLWTLPSVLCGGSLSMAIADLDGDGRAEVILGERRRIVALHGRTGSERAASPQLGDHAGQSRCVPVDVDGRAGDELVCLQSNQALPASEPGHRLFVLGHARDALGQAQLVVLWQRDVGEVHGQARFAATPVVDLDGDGALEVVTSGVDAGGAAITYVHDAATGALRATATGQRAIGTIPATAGPQQAMILTAQGDDLHAWRLTGDALALQWSLPDRRALLEPDWALVPRAYVAERVLMVDVAGHGAPALLTSDTVPGGALSAHELTGLAGTAPRTAASHALDAGVGLLAAWRAPTGAGDPAALLMATSNGRMQLLDAALAPVQRSVRFGGYLPRGDWCNLHLTPVTGDLGAGADSNVISDSRGALVRIDARDASLASPPVARWQVPDASSPILLGPAGPDGAYQRIACRQRTAGGTDRVLMLDRDGEPRWQAALPGVVLSDIVPARLQPGAGAGLDDLIVQWGRTSDVALQHRALAGDSGAVLWDAAAQSPGTARFPAGGAVTDWNDDGVDEFVHQYYGTQVLSGADGAILADNGDTDLVHFMPSIHDLDGDGRSEVVLHGGFAPARALDDDLVTPLWISPDHDLPYPYGAIAGGCADGRARLVGGSLMHPATLKLTPLAGPDAGVHQRMVLAGGEVYDDEAAAGAAGAVLGQLTSTAVHADLAGAGRPLAVVGSDDGWLYAVDACAAELAFAVPLGAAVGAIGFADTNADGMDEIVAAAGDGYLYALAQPPIAAPARVLDLAPGAAPLPDDIDGVADIDDIRGVDRMAAIWQPVPGADGYQVAVTHPDTGRVVSAPAWQDVGAATSAELTGLTLTPGARYVFAVRALSRGAASPDAMSDGVLVGEAAPAPPIPGDPDAPSDMPGCGCRSTEPNAATWLLVAVVAGLMQRRRRRV